MVLELGCSDNVDGTSTRMRCYVAGIGTRMRCCVDGTGTKARCCVLGAAVLVLHIAIRFCRGILNGLFVLVIAVVFFDSTLNSMVRDGCYYWFLLYILVFLYHTG